MTTEQYSMSYEEGYEEGYRDGLNAAVEPSQPLTNEQAEKQEPVAWMDEFGNVFPLGAQSGPKYLNEPMKPLYTTPPAAQRQWVGLTTEEIYACDEASELPQHEITNADLQAFAYAIEAKLKEKNT